METKPYNYTEAEYQEAFEKVKRDYIGQIQTEQTSKLIFAAGQPASGKSALQKNRKRLFTYFVCISRYG